MKGGYIVAITSLVLGIVSLVISVFFAGLNWLGIPVAIVGIILGALGRKNAEKKGMATAGLVMSIIALVLAVIVWLACAACVGAIASMA